MGDDSKSDKTGDDEPVRFKMSDFKAMMTELIDERIGAVKGNLGSGKTDGGDDSPKAEAASVADQVKAALDRLHKQEAREKRERGWDDAIEELKKSLQPGEDKNPIERRRIHKVMGWGEPDK